MGEMNGAVSRGGDKGTAARRGKVKVHRSLNLCTHDSTINPGLLNLTTISNITVMHKEIGMAVTSHLATVD